MKYATPPVAIDQGLTAFPNEPTREGLWPGLGYTNYALAMLVGPCVYFIRTQDDLIKIGYTSHLGDRHRQFGPGWDHLLAVVAPATLADERAAHERFAEYLDRGREWFWPGPDLIDHINDVRARLGVRAVDPWHFT